MQPHTQQCSERSQNNTPTGQLAGLAADSASGLQQQQQNADTVTAFEPDIVTSFEAGTVTAFEPDIVTSFEADMLLSAQL